MTPDEKPSFPPPLRPPAGARAPIGRVVKLLPAEQAPSHLGAEQRRMWLAYMEGWAIDHAGRQLLVLALEAHQRMRQAQRALKRAGLVVKGRLNPVVIVERDSRLAMLKALRQLGLDLEPLHDRSGRPAGKGA